MTKFLFSTLTILLLFFILTSLIEQAAIRNLDFLTGDNNSLLYTASSLITVSTVIYGFFATAAGFIFELSCLPKDWKIKLLKDFLLNIPTILWLSSSIFTIVILILALLSIHSYDAAPTAFSYQCIQQSTALLITSIVLGIYSLTNLNQLLEFSGAFSNLLEKLDFRTIETIQKATQIAFSTDFNSKKQLALIPMSGYASKLTEPAEYYHNELKHAFFQLIKINNISEIESELEKLKAWTYRNTISSLDNYFLHHLLPSIFDLINMDPETRNPAIFRTRIYILFKILAILESGGAEYTTRNFHIPMLGLMNDYLELFGIVKLLQYSLNPIRAFISSSPKAGLFLLQLGQFIPTLIQARTPESIYILDRLLDLYRDQLTFSDKTILNSEHLINTTLTIFKDAFTTLDTLYRNEKNDFAGHDYRAWILITLRRTQESLTETLLRQNLSIEEKQYSRLLFFKFSYLIRTLSQSCNIKPLGNKMDYKNRRTGNPFR